MTGLGALAARHPELAARAHRTFHKKEILLEEAEIDVDLVVV